MNKRGVALIFAYIVSAILTILSAGLLARTLSENTAARRSMDAQQSFWVAEAGMAQAFANWSNNQPISNQTISFGGGNFSANTSAFPTVNVTASFNGYNRTIQATFVRLPLAFQNTVSVGANMSLVGWIARIEVHGKTRISGNYTESGGFFAANGVFDDKQEGVPQANTTIPVPDFNGNGVANEFNDFVRFGESSVERYPEDDTCHYQTDDTIVITPTNNITEDKKVIFVEGSAPGKGNVTILFGNTWKGNQDLTVIATGQVTYLQPLQNTTNSRLSTASWGNYSEAAILRSQHESVIYTHGNGTFVDLFDWSSVTGNLIVNQDVSLRENLTYEKMYYSNATANGDIPPGFELLSAPSGTPMAVAWQEQTN